MSEPTGYSKAILNGLQGKPIYQGTVSAAEKASRRKRNKAARIARRANRK